jgi:purine nucleoside permease
MALGADPRFDLRQSHWLITGIAGISPSDGTIGSAVFADYVIDGDLAKEIDPRENHPHGPTASCSSTELRQLIPKAPTGKKTYANGATTPRTPIAAATSSASTPTCSTGLMELRKTYHSRKANPSGLSAFDIADLQELRAVHAS